MNEREYHELLRLIEQRARLERRARRFGQTRKARQSRGQRAKRNDACLAVVLATK